MIRIPRGTQDILPEDSSKWRYIENQLDKLMKLYNYKEIRTPIFESTDLFARGVGDSTDVVQKEMYTFKDKGDRSITLRPEGTALYVHTLRIKCKVFQISLLNYIIMGQCSDMNVNKKDDTVNSLNSALKRLAKIRAWM